MAPAATPQIADVTRAKLLDAAGEVFAEHGFQGATVREICAQAGVNVALVNYHFGDKLELYTEVLRHSLGPVEEEQLALETSLTPEPALRGYIRGAMRRMLRPGRPGWHYRLMMHEMAQPTPAMAKVIEDTMKPMFSNLCRLTGELMGISPDDEKARLSALSVIGQMTHYVYASQLKKFIVPELDVTPERIDVIADHVADFSLAYLNQQAVLTKGTGN